jgi:hypothetical protein
MSTILYYSNYCKSSTKVLQILSKYDMGDKVHFICIDGRINKNGETYAVLQNGQEILIPKNITAVPALLLLNQQYLVIYGVSEIINYFQKGMDQQIKQATGGNMVPMSKSQSQSQSQRQSKIQQQDKEETDGYGGFGGFFSSSGVVSDNFSFLDQDDAELSAKGNGGLRQMHHYAKPEDDVLFGSNNSNSISSSGNRIKDDDASSLLDKYREDREKDIKMYMPKREF